MLAKQEPAVPSKEQKTKSSAQERYRMVWDERMGHPGEVARYDKTSVMLLSWEESIDDLEVAKEVSGLFSKLAPPLNVPQVTELESVFRNLYGFKVYNEHLRDCASRPELQVRKYLTDFAHDEDDERTLLIVYYAGHGFSDDEVKPGDIKWTG